MPDYRCGPYVPPPDSELARWEAAIAGLVEISGEFAPEHERLPPTYTIAMGKCWRIKPADGRICWARADVLEPDRPMFYLPVDVARDCALRQALEYGRGIELAREYQHRDFGALHRLLCDAILNATPKRLEQHERDLAKRAAARELGQNPGAK